MAAMLHQLSQAYNYIVETGDSRGNKLPLVSNPLVPFGIIGLYVSFIHYGPRYFENRKPLSTKLLLKVYNLFMVFLSAYMFKEFLISSYLLGYDTMCYPNSKPVTAASIRMVRVTWLFYISKIIELADTVFTVVGKKGQLTFLHVFHHSSVIFAQWIFIKYFPISQGFFQALCNCFIHTLMYSYYFLACFPALKKLLWWKKYLTVLQMVQFVLVITHCGSVLYTGCDVPRWTVALCATQCFIILVLFGNYYVQTHFKRRQLELKSNKTE